MIKERGYRSIELGGHSFTLEWADEESGFLINLICQDIPNSNLLTPDSIFRLHTNNSKTKVTIFFGNRCIYRGINRIHGLNIIISTMLQQLELLILLRKNFQPLQNRSHLFISATPFFLQIKNQPKNNPQEDQEYHPKNHGKIH